VKRATRFACVSFVGARLRAPLRIHVYTYTRIHVHTCTRDVDQSRVPRSSRIALRRARSLNFDPETARSLCAWPSTTGRHGARAYSTSHRRDEQARASESSAGVRKGRHPSSGTLRHVWPTLAALPPLGSVSGDARSSSSKFILE